MANRHFGKFADVWKHLALVEVLAIERPDRYAETHAGSAAYPMIDDRERRFGIKHFLEAADRLPELARCRYRALVTPFVDERLVYPGSSLLAMAQLGGGTEYLLCDLDPASVADLRSWAKRLDTRCEVVSADGMAATVDWLDPRHADRRRAVVHIDPFDPHVRGEGTHQTDDSARGSSPPAGFGLSALKCAAYLAESGVGVVYWYGYDEPSRAAWAYESLRRSAPGVWCGDMMVVDAGGSGRRGDLGVATTPGTGCGVVLANVSSRAVAACSRLGRCLAQAYADTRLPDGSPGGIRFSARGNIEAPSPARPRADDSPAFPWSLRV